MTPLRAAATMSAIFMSLSSDGDGRLDVGPRIVAGDFEVLEPVVEDGVGLAPDHELRIGTRLAGELKLGLLHVIVIEVAVAARPDEVSDLEARLLRHHVREQRVARDVEGHAEEDVAGALVELAGEPAVGHVELEKAVAGRKRHLVHEARIPGAHDHAAAVGIGPELLHQVLDLVDVAAVGCGPAAPLDAVDGAEVAVLVGPLVPDRHAVVVQVLDVGAALKEPEQFVNDRAKVKLLRRDKRKAFRQIEAHLVAEDGSRAGACAVGLVRAVFVYVAHQGLVLIARHGAVSRMLEGPSGMAGPE